MLHFQNKIHYNKDKRKNTRLIQKVKKDDAQNCFIQSQKVPNDNSWYPTNEEQEYQENAVQNFSDRPLTAEGGPRQYFGGRQRDNRNSTRGVSRKHKIRGAIMQHRSKQRHHRWLAQQRNIKKEGFFKTERKKSLQHLKNYKTNLHKAPIYHEDDVKDLKIVDYFNGLNRLNRYVKKTKERLRNDAKDAFKFDINNSKILSPFKKSLLNVDEIYKFVEEHQNQNNDLHESKEDEQAIVISDKQNKNAQAIKWKKVMDFFSHNPKMLVDALYDPDPTDKQLYHPVFDEIIDEENKHNDDKYREKWESPDSHVKFVVT